MEIEGAIRILADHQNFIAAELLASAAVDVIAGIAKDADVSTMTAQFEERIKPEKRREALRMLRKPYNFLKHSDRDKGSAIDRYNSDAAIWRIFMAITDYETVWKSKSVTMATYLVWFLARHPHLLTDEGKPLTDAYTKQYGLLSDKSQSEGLAVLERTFREYDEVASEVGAAMSKLFPGNVEI